MSHLLVGLLIGGVCFPLSKVATHERLIRWWSGRLLAICRVQLKFIDCSEGTAVSRALIVSNHVSWLDIFVMNAQQPCYFVAKSDIRSWPMIGWLSQKAGTIFLERGKQREVRRIYEGLVQQIHAGKRIAFFPEGTTAAQGSILPFHANLFEAAIEAQVPIEPFSIRYLDASNKLHPAVDFIGEMTIVESMQAILKGGEITAELRQLRSISTEDAHRREIALAARLAVAQSLGIEIKA
ncbi:lysophospholipid acyltransferase family protein [Undibacterium sp. Ren11W]|uniref:lysophospholipid acyltransferase family protein n=1 Tax=Undibacterium sp. Ren11W TaxID=3413045 RepID=UPI003BF26556